MKYLITALFLCLLINSPLMAQLPNGSPASDFSVTTLNGSFSLYSSMAGGKAACLDFMATWCGPCWNFHNSGVLEEVNSKLSAKTSILMIEADFATNTNCLYNLPGCTGSGTWGDWVTGTPYPIADLTSSNGGGVKGLYNITYFPTLYVISPDKRVWEIINRDYSEYENWILHSFELNATATTSNSTCGNNGSIILNVTGGYNNLYYKWSNGDKTKDLNGVGGGTYSVTITDDNGYFESYGPWTISGPTKAVSFTNTSTTNNKCHGDANGKISVSVAYGTAPYTYDWTPSTIGNGNSVSNLPAGPYSLQVVDAAGCTLNSSFVITEPPAITQYTYFYPEQCDEQDGKIEVLANGGSKPFKYDIGKGKQSSNIFQNLKGGFYKITITDNNLCSETATGEVLASHKPKTEAGINDKMICPMDSLLLTGVGTVEGANYSYVWTTKSGKILSNPNQLPIQISKGGTYVLHVKDLVNACENIDSVVISDQRIYPNVSATGDGKLNCAITQLELKGNSNSKNTKYYWSKIGSNYVDTSATIKSSESGQFVFNVKDTLNECISKDTVTVLLDQKKPDVNIQAANDLTCTVSQSVLDALTSSSGNDYTVKWTSQNGHIVSGDETLNPIVDKPGDYLLTIFNKTNKCESSSSVTVLQDIAIPNINISGNTDILLCKNNFVNIDANGSSTGPRFDVIWSTNDGNILSGTNTLTPTVDKTGTYTILIKDKINGCQNSKLIQVGQQDNPIAIFEISKNNAKIDCKDFSTGNVKSYHWDFGDGTISTEANPSHEYAIQSDYKVCLTVENDCGKNTICRNVNLTATGQVHSLSEFTVEPNPANEYFDISIKFDKQVTSNLILKNTYGQIILNNRYDAIQIAEHIDSKSIIAGMYFVQLLTEEGKTQKTIIILK